MPAGVEPLRQALSKVINHRQDWRRGQARRKDAFHQRCPVSWHRKDPVLVGPAPCIRTSELPGQKWLNSFWWSKAYHGVQGSCVRDYEASVVFRPDGLLSRRRG